MSLQKSSRKFTSGSASGLTIYREQQKLSERKVLWITGFHPDVRKIFAVFASSVWKVLKKATAQQNICRENFHGSSKICENHKPLTFVVYIR